MIATVDLEEAKSREEQETSHGTRFRNLIISLTRKSGEILRVVEGISFLYKVA